ncbi:putative cyclic nucleotide-gated ion channel 8 [Bienertia sinuspersici]
MQYVGASYYSDYILQLLYCKSKLFLEDGNVNSIDADWSQLQAICDLKDKTERGIFSAFHANGIGSRSFFQRAMYCFSLGLKSLSSMGQNFETGYLASETLFSFLMSMCGLVLFAGLIAEMQTSIQSAQTGDEQPIVRLREIEKWTKIHQLPPELKARVRQTVSAELIATRNIDEKSILDLLPSELQCDIRRQFYRDLVRNLPFFENLDDQLLHSFCGFLRTASFSKGACLVAEGEPVRQIFFIYSGLLEGMVLDGGCSSLREGDLCGTELLSWVLKPSASTRNLPASAQTVMCLTNIDAFCILAEDLKLLSVQFNHDSKFQQALSCPSQQSIHSAVP